MGPAAAAETAASRNDADPSRSESAQALLYGPSRLESEAHAARAAAAAERLRELGNLRVRTGDVTRYGDVIRGDVTWGK